jgi:hypothetical protein
MFVNDELEMKMKEAYVACLFYLRYYPSSKNNWSEDELVMHHLWNLKQDC